MQTVADSGRTAEEELSNISKTTFKTPVIPLENDPINMIQKFRYRTCRYGSELFDYIFNFKKPGTIVQSTKYVNEV